MIFQTIERIFVRVRGGGKVLATKFECAVGLLICPDTYHVCPMFIVLCNSLSALTMRLVVQIQVLSCLRFQRAETGSWWQNWRAQSEVVTHNSAAVFTHMEGVYLTHLSVLFAKHHSRHRLNVLVTRMTIITTGAKETASVMIWHQTGLHKSFQPTNRVGST